MTTGSKDLEVLVGEYGAIPLNGGDQSGILWDAPLRIVVVTARLKINIGKYKAGDGADLDQSFQKNTVSRELTW